MLPKKHLSGCAIHKFLVKNVVDENLTHSNESLRDSINENNNKIDHNDFIDDNEDNVESNLPNDVPIDVNKNNVENESNFSNDVSIDDNEDNVENESNLPNDEPNISNTLIDIYDPMNWTNLDNKTRDIITTFSKYTKLIFISKYTELTKMNNVEISDRKWLVYSKHVDKVFYFCCKLFKSITNKSLLANDGLRDWKHINDRLKQHENSTEHMNNMFTWIEMRETIMKEKNRWRQVLIGIFSSVKCLATHNLAFKGSNEKLYQDDNERIQNRDIHHHYLGHKIQNELIFLLAYNVKSSIIKTIKKAKYFSIILDCTPDISHKEQMTLIIRCVIMSNEKIKIEDYFLEFLEVLKSLNLNIDDVRGQGYDNNGSNMKGKHQGVQKRLLEVNPSALYMPCACHRLNLSLSDMAHSYVRAVSFFGIVQRIYALFSGSSKRLKILLDNFPGLTLNFLSNTIWESRIKSVKAIRFQAPQLRVALSVLYDSCDSDAKSKSEAESLYNALGSFEFLLGMNIWYELLFVINKVSKKLQFKFMCIDTTIVQVEGIMLYFEKFRRRVFRKRHFDETNEEDEQNQSPEEVFRFEYFLVVVDMTIATLKSRFEQLKLLKLKSLDEKELRKCCVTFHSTYTSDVDLNDLYSELKVLQSTLPNKLLSATEILEFVKSADCYPNASIAYRIFLTVPVTVASAERSFSKLKLIKTYSSSSMSEERLNGLAMLSIEKELLENIDVDDIYH
ncbi:hypothetical protein RND81_03G059100 [Saponaria officinalis]|uniref:HAT C-terminal dimerisation domain-containing protein n=1 Tax=Saponaria officinalis TaxID=3572 RepID=A0AAW1M524_SAPOF